MESLTSNSSFKPVSSQRSGIAIKSLTFIGFDLFSVLGSAVNGFIK